MDSKIEEPLDIESKAQVQELISLFRSSQNPDFKPNTESKLPKELVASLTKTFVKEDQTNFPEISLEFQENLVRMDQLQEPENFWHDLL